MPAVFGRRSTKLGAMSDDSKSLVASAPTALLRYVFVFVAAITAIGVIGFVAVTALTPKSFPSHGTVTEKCLYAVGKLQPSLSAVCSEKKEAEDIVEGFHLWEQYAVLEADFPFLSDSKTRCIIAVVKGNVLTMKRLGVTMADENRCMFDGDREEVVRFYFGMLKGLQNK